MASDGRLAEAPPPNAIDLADLAPIQRRTTIVLILMQITGTVGVGVAPSIGILLAGEVTQNEAWAGLARSASTLGAAVFGLPLGSLAARHGRRVALATGWWTAGAGGMLLVVAAQLSLVVPLFIGLLLIGAGSATSLQSRFAAADLAEPRNKARALGLVVWVGTLGSVLGPNLGIPGEWMERATGLTVFASAFLIAAVCLLLAGAVVFALLRPDPLTLVRQVVPEAQPGRTGPRRGRLRQVMAELRVNPPARHAVLAVLTAQVVMVSMMTMTPVHMAMHGDTVTIVGVTISLHIVGMYGLAPLVGRIADLRGHRFTILVGVGIFLASLVVGALWPDQTGGIIVSLILLGVGWSFVNVAGSAMFSTVVSQQNRATSQGGVDALSNLCGAVAAFVAGPLLVLSSFSLLAILSIGLLVPLTVVTVLRRHVTVG